MGRSLSVAGRGWSHHRIGLDRPALSLARVMRKATWSLQAGVGMSLRLHATLVANGLGTEALAGKGV